MILLESFVKRIIYANTKTVENKDKVDSINNNIIETESISNKKVDLNGMLLELKEFKYLYQKTGIPPKYFIWLILICFSFMVIGYLENLLSFVFGLIYPLYYSIKSLRERNRSKIRDWLKYWIVFSILMNFEGVFEYFLDQIPLYFFYKVVFLLICFLPNYNGAKYFYEIYVKNMFNTYGSNVYEISVAMASKLKATLLESDGEDCEDENSDPKKE